MVTPVRVAHSEYDERFYQDAIASLRLGAAHNIPADAVIAQVKSQAALLNAALKDTTFKAAVFDVLSKKLPQGALGPDALVSAIEGICHARLQAQGHIAQLLENPAVVAEVKQRAASGEMLQPYAPVADAEAQAVAARYVQAIPALGKAGVATAVLGEHLLQHALALTFNSGNDKPLHGPLMEAMQRAGGQPGPIISHVAESFLSSRTQEAMARAALLTANGPVMQQVQQSWVGKTGEQRPQGRVL